MVLYAQISTGILLTREICDATVKTLLQSFEKVDDRTALASQSLAEARGFVPLFE